MQVGHGEGFLSRGCVRMSIALIHMVEREVGMGGSTPEQVRESSELQTALLKAARRGL